MSVTSNSSDSSELSDIGSLHSVDLNSTNGDSTASKVSKISFERLFKAIKEFGNNISAFFRSVISTFESAGGNAPLYLDPRFLSRL